MRDPDHPAARALARAQLVALAALELVDADVAVVVDVEDVEAPRLLVVPRPERDREQAAPRRRVELTRSLMSRNGCGALVLVLEHLDLARALDDEQQVGKAGGRCRVVGLRRSPIGTASHAPTSGRRSRHGHDSRAASAAKAASAAAAIANAIPRILLASSPCTPRKGYRQRRTPSESACAPAGYPECGMQGLSGRCSGRARVAAAALVLAGALAVLAPTLAGSPAAAGILGGQPNVLVSSSTISRTARRISCRFSRRATTSCRYGEMHTNNPLCCPARSTMLSGEYSHHTGVENNSTASAADSDDSSTLATWFDDAGYETGLFGKYAVPRSRGPGDVCSRGELRAQVLGRQPVDGPVERGRVEAAGGVLSERAQRGHADAQLAVVARRARPGSAVKLRSSPAQ